MAMGDLESRTILEVEKLKAKAAIAVAALNNSSTGGFSGMSELGREKLLEYIKEVQATLDDE